MPKTSAYWPKTWLIQRRGSPIHRYLTRCSQLSIYLTITYRQLNYWLYIMLILLNYWYRFGIRLHNLSIIGDKLCQLSPNDNIFIINFYSRTSCLNQCSRQRRAGAGQTEGQRDKPANQCRPTPVLSDYSRPLKMVNRIGTTARARQNFKLHVKISKVCNSGIDSNVDGNCLLILIIRMQSV